MVEDPAPAPNPNPTSPDSKSPPYSAPADPNTAPSITPEIPTDMLEVTPNFRISSRDSQGGSEHVNFRIMPHYLRSIRQLILSGAVPDFKTESDFYRFAVHLSLDFIQRVTKFRSSFWGQIILTDALIDDMNREEAVDGLIEKLKVNVARRKEAGAVSEARRMVEFAIQSVNTMDSGYHRDKALREIQFRFGELLGDNGTGPVNELGNGKSPESK